MLITDGYKTGHHGDYPDGISLVYSNLTARSNKYAINGCDYVISFGSQKAMREIHDLFQEKFFSKPKDEVCSEIKAELSLYLNKDYDVTHFEKLHDLGYLPICVKSITEGTKVPIKVPIITIYNTHPDFFWVTNYLETILSCLMWKPITSATIAHQYRKLLSTWQRKTDRNNEGFVDWQAHDFSMRGLDSIDASISSGLGHATCFYGSDSLPVIHGARKYYDERGFVIGSVPATEHSVMCAGGKEDEIETFKRLLRIHPKGILSVVSDTWDLWNVITKYLPQLKDDIMSRDGKLVIRPDSGNPCDIICGLNTSESNDKTLDKDHPSYKGVIELLWDIFGGSINDQGFKVLDSHIGAIYGDSITIQRADEICRRLAAKGFATTNIVLGIGSYTYQLNTRDTFGMAIKATYVEINNKPRKIFKDPITDDGTKKSATGLLLVYKDGGNLILKDQVSWEEENTGELKLIYRDGSFYNKTTLTKIREIIKNDLVADDLKKEILTNEY